MRVLRNRKNLYLLSSEIKMNISNVSIFFITLHNVLKTQRTHYLICQVELKLSDFTLLDAHSLPTHVIMLEGVSVDFLKCVCATSSLSYSLCIHKHVSRPCSSLFEFLYESNWCTFKLGYNDHGYNEFTAITT